MVTIHSSKKKNICLATFLITQLLLYSLILTTGGNLLVYSSFFAIILCFAFSALHLKTGSKLITAGLACTVAADYCLVVCSPALRLPAMVFFLVAQNLYAVRLYKQNKNKILLYTRIGITALAVSICVAVLRQRVDLLALVSLCYYAALICNLICAFADFRKNRLLAVGFLLFLLCDTVIGLQVASEGYLAIPQQSVLYRILFMDFHLSWFFYLPSQVLISISGRKR